MKRASFILTSFLVLSVGSRRCPALDFGGADEVTAVSSRTSPDYVRARQPNGAFVPESYAFGPGGNWAGFDNDYSIDKVTFLEVARTIAGPLAAQNFVPATDPAKTKLLIMVYWGTTHTPLPANQSPELMHLQDAYADVMRNTHIYQMAKSAPGFSGGGVGQEPGWSPISGVRIPAFLADEVAAAQDEVEAAIYRRENEDLINIRMLGYDSWWERTRGDLRGTAFQQDRTDLYEEIEESRYFVVLMAYDFQLMWRHRQHRLLWETRFSIRQQHHEFDRELPALAQYASRYFGQDSRGLVHDRIPLGQVQLGDVKSLGEVAPQR